MIQKTIEFLKKCDSSYYNTGESLISDSEYDVLRVELKALYPQDPYFNTVGAPVESKSFTELLPVALGSLNQFVNNKEINNWVDKYDIESDWIIGQKLDGYSGLLEFNYGKLQRAFSHGDGIEAKNITRHVLHIPSIPKEISNKELHYIRGEIILKNSIFSEKYSEKYKNGRNMVAGIMMRNISDVSILNDFSFFAHEHINSVENKSTSYDYLKQLGFLIPYYELFSDYRQVDLKSVLTEKIIEYKSNSDYELDGIVVTVDNLKDFESKSKSQSLNPEHSFKFKLEHSQSAETVVTHVEWNSSKNGLIKPIIHIQPVELHQTTVSKLSGNNLRFIVDNGIAEGSKIVVIKAGDVIPKLLKVIEAKSPQYPDEFDWEWNLNHKDEQVEAVLKNKNDPEVVFKQVLDFFTSLEVDQFGEGTLTELINRFNLNNESYDIIVSTIIKLFDIEFERVIGVNGGKIYKSLHRRLQNISYSTLCGSLNYCGPGIGIRKFNQIFEQTTFENLLNMSIRDISELKGFDTKTATQVYNGMPKIKEFLELHLDYIKFKKVEVTTDEFKALNVVFTEVRDDQLELLIKSKGGKIGSGVSGKTTHLVVKNKLANTGKLQKARELNIPIYTLDEFKDLFNL